MMNRKGQVLVVFILLLPLIFIFVGIGVDLGNNLITKRKNENIVRDALTYIGKDLEFNETKLRKNLQENLEYETLELTTNENVLKIKVISKVKTIFGSVFDLGLDHIEFEVEYDLENKRIIRK